MGVDVIRCACGMPGVLVAGVLAGEPVTLQADHCRTHATADDGAWDRESRLWARTGRHGMWAPTWPVAGPDDTPDGALHPAEWLADALADDADAGRTFGPMRSGPGLDRRAAA